MAYKCQVLIIENRKEWQTVLAQMLPEATTEIQTIQTYNDAITVLEHHPFDLAIIDLTLDISAHDYDRDGTHDGLQVLVEVAKRFPKTRLIALGESGGSDTLRNTPGVPANLAVIEKTHWDQAAFRTLLDGIISNVPPQSSMIPVATPKPTEEISPIIPDLPRTSWLTSPLNTGLTPPGVGSRPGRPRVLIVEDQALWQQTIAELMELEGYFWRVAPTHEQALERLRLESFHVVLIDLVLGDLQTPWREGQGWQVLDYLVSHCPKTKVIVISGHASSADVARLFMGYPIKGFIDKQAFSPNELRSIVREQIAGPVLRIQTLGDFRIRRDGKLINDFGHDLAETVIKILLTRRGNSISVNELIDYLWPESEPKDNYTNLGIIIGSARAALEPDLPRSTDSKFIMRNGANYQFNVMNVEVDAEQLRQLVSEGRQHERQGEIEQAIKNYKAAREIYHGDYLPGDRFARWTMQERAALQNLYTDMLNRLADLYAGLGNLKLAIEVASQALQIDAYAESTYRRLMRYHACNNNLTSSLSVYRALVKLFSEFFNEEPSAETIQLQEAIAAGRQVDCVEEPTKASSERRLTPSLNEKVE